MALEIVSALVAWLRGWERPFRIFVAMLLSCLLSGIVANACRFLAGRTRPGVNVPQGFYGIVRGGDSQTDSILLPPRMPPVPLA